MKHRLLTLFILAGVLLMFSPSLTFAQLVKQKMNVKPQNQVQLLHKKADQPTIDLMKRMAQPITAQEDVSLRALSLKPIVDYSPFVTLVRDQAQTNYCCIYTAAALVDIIKEKERPYTPDVSTSFINYAYQESIKWYPDDPRINIPGTDGQMGVVKNLGVVTEADLSSRNYDPAQVGRTPAQAEIPSNDEINRLAPLLRIKEHKVVKFTKEEGLIPLKAYLSKGPVGVLSDDHCMALIGYNDDTRLFTFQNSWGSTGNNRGFVQWSYDDMLNRFANASFTVVTNTPTAPGTYVYAVRIKLMTPDGRNNLTVKVGAEGEVPYTLWAPAPYGATDCGNELVMDAPLPSYAGNHWPPNASNPWYLEVNYPSGGGLIKDVVLVKRGFNNQGEPLSMIFRPSTSNFAVSPVNGEKVNIPSRMKKQLVLSPNPKILTKGQSVTFNVTLINFIEASSSKNLVTPVKYKQVDVWEVRPDQLEQGVQVKQVGTASTDETGKCSIAYTPGVTAQYRAYAKETDGTIIAVSDISTVTVTVNKIIPNSKRPILR